MVVEQFKKLWLPRGVDFMIVPELSADHCITTITPTTATITISSTTTTIITVSFFTNGIH